MSVCSWKGLLPSGRQTGGWCLSGVVAIAVLVAACSRSTPPPSAPAAPLRTERPAVDPRLGTSPSRRLAAEGERIPKGGGVYKIGSPYRIAGRWYVPQVDPAYDRSGIASWYGADFHGRRTANGEIYDMNALTAAHPTLPLPSYAWVSNEANGRTVLVRINDRGPYAHDRIIDLSRAVARALGTEAQGLGRVRVRYAGNAPLNGDDRREIAHLRAQPWFGQPVYAQPVYTQPGRRAPMPPFVAQPRRPPNPPAAPMVTYRPPWRPARGLGAGDIPPLEARR